MASPYSLRVTNTQYGAVELSADDGGRWTLVGRVAKPAIDRAPGGTGSLPVVERSSAQGAAIGIGQGKILRLLPDNPANRRDPAAIVVNLPPTASLFKDLLPGPGSPVQQIVKGKALPLPADYSPQDGDQLLITAAANSMPAERITALVKDAGDRYREDVLARLRAIGKSPSSGILTVNAALPPGEKLNAVSFVLDGSVLALENTAPFTLRCNTKEWPNGEHLLEVRGLDTAGRPITQTKTLIVVENAP